MPSRFHAIIDEHSELPFVPGSQQHAAAAQTWPEPAGAGRRSRARGQPPSLRV